MNSVRGNTGNRKYSGERAQKTHNTFIPNENLTDEMVTGNTPASRAGGSRFKS